MHKGCVKIELVFFLTTKRSVDIDNMVKPLLDGLNKIVIEDDKFINELNIRKYEDSKTDCIKIRIYSAC